MLPNGNAQNLTRRRPALALISLVAGAGLLLSACSGDDPVRQDGDATPAAIPSVDARLRELPADAHAALASARTMLREGRFEEAAAAFEASGAAAGDDLARAEAHLGAAIALFEADERDQSVDFLRRALDEAPEDGAVRRRAAYLLGLRLNDRGDHAGAAKMLRIEAERATEDALQPFVLAEYARALHETGAKSEAEAAWEALVAQPELPDSLRVQAARELATAAREAGDGEREARWLFEAVAVSGEPSLRLRLAEASARNGDHATFAEQLQTIVQDSPASHAAREALAGLADAGIAVTAGDEGLVHYRHGNLEAAQAVLEAAAETLETKLPAVQAFELFYLGATYEDQGKHEEAIATYDRAAMADPGSVYAHRAKYWAARVSEALDNNIAAALRYADLAVNGPAGEFSSESAFRAGYTLLEGGDPAGAVTTWDQMGAAATARVLYWKGRAFEALADAEAATASFEAAIATDPLDFYGEEAARRLGQSGPADISYKPLGPLPTTDWAAFDRWLAGLAGERTVTTSSRAAVELSALGLTNAAERVVRDAAKGGGPWALADGLRLAEELAMPNLTAELAVKLRQELGLTWQEAPVELLRLAYPVGYPGLVDRVARENDLDPLLLAALIRQESYWDADAGSHAGALGLTQVIPPTGEAIAQTLGLRNFKADDLFRPAVSVPFGGHYIGIQLRRYGNPYEALAAYNAGPGPVGGWAETAGAGWSPADFVEAVSYAETQGYVVYVMEHFAHYRQAWRR